MTTFVFPVPSVDPKPFSPYGPRDLFGSSFHYGDDWSAPIGTPIVAPIDAIVIEGKDRAKGSVQGFGNWVWLRSEKYNVDMIFGHMRHESILVRKGDRVTAGQKIAEIGNEGQSTGPHLHGEVWIGKAHAGINTRVSMYNWLSSRITSPVEENTRKGENTLRSFNFNESDQTGKYKNRSSSRNGAKPTLFVLHTQEGNGTAQSLANYFLNANVSYHYTVDNSGSLIGVIDTDRSSWSALDANPYTINLCFAGSRAGQTREQWLNNYSKAIDIAAQLAVRDARKYGMTIEVLGRNYDRIRATRRGFIDHSGITYGLKIGTHTDCGPNFPWDYFTERVNYWNSSEPVQAIIEPVINMIDQEAVNESSWIGKRLHDGEKPCLDKVGRYAQFENGTIYWHSRTGAHAIPNEILQKYQEVKWEQGELGYPVGDATKLTDGWVQGFEGGAIYRRNGRDGFILKGLIREQWNRSGFEAGPYGWPISDELSYGRRAKAQQFENGSLIWDPDNVVGFFGEASVDTESYTK